MAKVITDEQNYQDIANAIRAKLGSADTYTPSEMAAAIGTISGGGADSPLDPEIVYLSTRPADWLKMPTPQSNEVYALLHIPSTAVLDDEYALYIQSNSLVTGDSATVSFGETDSSGNFTPNPNLVFTSTDRYNNMLYFSSIKVPASAFSHATSDGHLQLMMKITSTATITTVSYDRGMVGGSYLRNYVLIRRTVEIAENIDGTSNGVYGIKSPVIKYYTNTAATVAPNLQNCYSLLLIRLPNATNIIYWRSTDCYSLIAVPQLDIFTGTQIQFSGCRSIRAIPGINTSNITTLNSAFSNCNSLRSVPVQNLPLVTGMSNTFQNCDSLEEVSGLTFQTTTKMSFQSAFQGCAALKKVSFANVPKVSSLLSTFANCYALTELPNMDTSEATTMQGAFDGCYALKSIPQYNTGKVTNFNYAFRNTWSMEKTPALDTSKGTSFNYMFLGCGVTVLDLSQYDFSSASSTSSLQMFATVVPNAAILLGNSFWDSGNTSSIYSQNDMSSSYGDSIHIKILKTDAMPTLTVNASTLFPASSWSVSTYVYVPDNLLATYQADTYWSTLGARLKGYSEWPY